jgi:hypothetical protein
MGQTRYRLRRRILRKRSVGERLTRIVASNCGLAVHVKAYCIRIAGSRCIAILNPHISLNRTGSTRAGARDCELGGCLKSPVFQSARSASRSTCAVCSVHHSSVLSVKRTRTYGIPSSKTCSAQSTILPRTPRYCFPGLGKSLVSLSAVFFHWLAPFHLRNVAERLWVLPFPFSWFLRREKSDLGWFSLSKPAIFQDANAPINLHFTVAESLLFSKSKNLG